MTFIHPVFPWNPQILSPFRHPRMLRNNSRQLRTAWDESPEDSQDGSMELENQRVVFVSSRILDSRFMIRRHHSLARNSRETELTTTQSFEAQSPPDLRKGSGGWNPRGVLIQSSEACGSSIQPRTRTQLMPAVTKPIHYNNKVSLNALSTSSKQQFFPKILTQMELPEGMISYNELL